MFETLKGLRSKAKHWLTLSVFLVFLLVLVFGFSQVQLLRVHLFKDSVVSDNQAWVISQLEVDYQKLKQAVSEAERDLLISNTAEVPQAAWGHLQLAFDIYYSRVSTVEIQGVLLSHQGDLPERYKRNEALVEINRELLANIIDQVETPDREVLEKIKAQLALVEAPVRNLAVNTIAVLSERADFERSAMRKYSSLRAVVFFLTVALLSVVAITIYLMLKDVRRQYWELDHSIKTRERILRQISRASIFTDSKGNIISSNKGVKKLFGWNEHEVLGVKIWEILLPEKRRRCSLASTRENWAESLNAGESVTIREIAIDRNGWRFPVEIVIMYLQVEDEKTYLFNIRSLVVEQRAMRALRRDRISAEKLAFRNYRLLSVMSHEMRTPLHAVIAALDLTMRHKLRPEANRLIKVAHDAAQTTLTYADDALDLVQIESRPEIVRSSNFSPSEVISEVIEMLRPAALQNNNTIVSEFEVDQHEIVNGKPDLLRHAISNLLSNAIKFTNHGKITVRLTRAFSTNRFKLEVVDTGIGILKEDQKRIISDADDLSRSRQSKTTWKGSGLGLGLFKRAVSVMGGRWGLESELGNGSQFWFTFPVNPAEKKPVQRKMDLPTLLNSPSQPIRVLAVDDNSINLNLLGKMLTVLDIPHDLASSGAEAVQAAHETPFDIVLLDMGMPGMDGYQTATEIRKIGHSCGATLMAFTADATVSKDMVKAQQAGIDDILMKPVTMLGLKAKIDQHSSAMPAMVNAMEGEDITVPASIIDEEVVAHLVSLGGINALLPLIDSLFTQTADLDAMLRSASESDPKELKAQFHGLVGAAGMMGATLLAQAAKNCESTVETDHSVMPEHVAAFTNAVRATKSSFAKIVAKYQAECRGS